MTEMSADEENFPPGFILFITIILDVFFNLFRFPQWRNYIPFGFAEQDSNRWLSYIVPNTECYPKLLTYTNFLVETRSNNSIAGIYKYAFQTPSTELGSINNTESLFALFILVLILRQVKSVFLPIFRAIGRSVGRSAQENESDKLKHNQERITKFGEYVFRLLYHFSVSLFGMWYFWNKSWWDHSKGGTEALWLGYPNHPIEVAMIWYYLVQSAYNVEALISLVALSFVFEIRNPVIANEKKMQSPIFIGWSPTCRGDFREMAIHHIITNILVIGSSHLRFTRIGSMVFLVHDISDVTVDLSKLANFVKWKLGTVIFFVTMVLVWAVTRLGILPFVIFKSILSESHMLTLSGAMHPLMFRAYHFFFTTLVGSIILLHIFWFFIILRIGWRLLRKGETHDLTEHKKGEAEMLKIGSRKTLTLSKKNI